MKEEDIAQLSQLLQTMKEIAEKIQVYKNKGDSERILGAKREVLNLQRKVNRLLR